MKEHINEGGEVLEHKTIEVEGSIEGVDKELFDQNGEIETVVRELRGKGGNRHDHTYSR